VRGAAPFQVEVAQEAAQHGRGVVGKLRRDHTVHAAPAGAFSSSTGQAPGKRRREGSRRSASSKICPTTDAASCTTPAISPLVARDRRGAGVAGSASSAARAGKMSAGEDDHVHLLVEYPPTVQLSRLVGSLKGPGSRDRDRHPEEHS
jgi:hypothetical protein